MRSEKTFHPDIQGLRAIAVIAVVLFHAGFQSAAGGFIGVDVFFVISGYLITGSIKRAHEAGDFSLPEFYTRRARRLFPALLATLALTFIAAAIFFSPPLFADFSKSLAASIVPLSNIYFWANSGYFDSSSILKPLLHTWSLSVEEQFYLLWPAFLLLSLSWRKPALMLGGLGLASFLALYFWPWSSNDTFFLTPFRVYQFTVGAALVWVPAVRQNAAREVINFSGLALIAFAVFYFDETTPQAISGMVASAAAALVLLGGKAPFTGLVLRNPASLYIGRISYSVYLAHWPVVVFWAYLIQRPFERWEKVGLVLLAIALGALLFHFVEDRWRAPRKKLATKRYWITYAVVVMVVVAGGVQASSGGWTWRLLDREPQYLAMLSGNGGASPSYGGKGCSIPACHIGPDRAPDLYVIGDSHARAYYAGLKQAFPNLSIDLFTDSGCMFFSPQYTRNYAGDQEAQKSCEEAREMAFGAITSTPAPVVIAQSWNETQFISASGEVESIGGVERLVEFVSAEIEALEVFLRKPPMLIIGNVPTAGGSPSPLDCAGRPVLVTDCSGVPRSSADIDYRSRINDLLAEKLSAIGFTNPYVSLCDANNCATFSGNAPLYSDNDHLTATGASIVISSIREAITGLVR